MKKMFLSFLVALLFAVPVFGAEAEGRYVSEETDTTLVEALEEAEAVADDAEEIVENGEIAMVDFDSEAPELKRLGSKKKYYSQAKYKCNDGYDVIAAYILENGEYKSRLFFVYESLYGEWLRYDYSLMAAETFLSDWELKESNGTTLYVPVVKKDSDDNTVAHKDREGTALDESKIPVIRAEDVSSINYAWKDLSEIPFLMNGGEYVYASTTVEDPDPTPTPTPTPEPEDDNTKVVNGKIGSNTYQIIYTASVKYDGRAHVWDQKRLSSKALSKKVNDVSVAIYRNGMLLAAGDYNVKFKNNVKVASSEAKKAPFFKIILKGKGLKKDAAALKTVKFKFDIVE